MALVPHKITALAESDAQGTDGKNIVAGAVVSLYDTTGTAVTLFDDAAGTNGSTAKTTDAKGQVVVWVTPGEYDEEVNGSTQRRVTVGGNSPIELPTFASLGELRPTKTGQAFICQERANAKYILQASGYTALAGDVTFANGRVGALQFVGEIKAGWFGAIGNPDETTEIQQALDRLSVAGGSVSLNPQVKYTVSNLTIPDNVCLYQHPFVLPDQDEGSVYGYADFYGCLFVSGTITMSGHGSALRGVAVLNANLSGYTPPTNDTEALAIVSAFSGTGLTVSGTGTTVRDCIILGFNQAISYGGNRHRCESVRFDCTSGIVIGGGSDVSRLRDVHGWPYLTTELSLSMVVNYRSGTAYKLQNNADKYSFTDLYCFGYEVGFHFAGSESNIAQSCVATNISADSGEIGGTGTSVGIYVDDYVADLTIFNGQAQNCDNNIIVDTRGADVGGGERLNTINFIGGVNLEPSTVFLKVDNGVCKVNGMTFQKGSTASNCIEWNTADGGTVIGCDFSEMFAADGAGEVISFASTAVENSVSRSANLQKSTIHPNNRFQDNFMVGGSAINGNIKAPKAAGTLTVSGGVIDASSFYHAVDTEGGASTDDIDTINGGSDGQLLTIKANSSSRTIVLKDGTGNLALAGDMSLDNAADRILLQYDENIDLWVELSRSGNSG